MIGGKILNKEDAWFLKYFYEIILRSPPPWIRDTVVGYLSEGPAVRFFSSGVTFKDMSMYNVVFSYSLHYNY